MKVREADMLVRLIDAMSTDLKQDLYPEAACEIWKGTYPEHPAMMLPNCDHAVESLRLMKYMRKADPEKRIPESAFAGLPGEQHQEEKGGMDRRGPRN